MMAHAYSGMRWERFENFAGAKEIELHVYGAEGFPCYLYDKMLDESFVVRKNINKDIESKQVESIYDTPCNYSVIFDIFNVIW